MDVLQSHYNLLHRDAEQDVLPYTREHGISFVPYFPLAAGLLGGKYRAEDTFTDIRKNNPLFQGEAFVRNLAKVDQVRAIADAKDAEVAHVILAWYLTVEGIDALIPGAKRPDQVLSNLKTLKVELTPDEIQRIDSIFAS